MELRSEIEALIAEGALARAAQRLAGLWSQEKGPAAAAFTVSRFEKIKSGLNLLPYRLFILRSFTVEPVVPMLRASAFCAGIDLSVELGDFNAYAQEILDGKSPLYRSSPHAAILAVQTCDVAPDLWFDYAGMAANDVDAARQRVSTSFAQWMRAFRERSPASLIVHTLEHPASSALGILDAQRETRLGDTIESINQEIGRHARGYRGVYLLDYDGLMARHGRKAWRDDRKWLLARLPVAAHQLIHLAEEWMRFLVPLSGKTSKALVVDLDNTLWGGIIGEDGMNGIQLGPEYPGAAYQALQRALVDISRRGILLAICSKNNPDEALEVLEKHSGMLVRRDHFAAMRIGWNEKAQSLREIASELNIGLDSLAFLDDNPFEREQVRAALPEVTVIDLPSDPLQYAATVRACPVFERLSLSSEDQQRTAFYAAERGRAQAEQSFQSKEDFFHFLQQEAEIRPLQPDTLGRVAQLTQKTNQFNLTTRRYSEQQIAEMAKDPAWQVLSIRVRDRFGDHGLVGVAITCDEAEDCRIDTFLLSCRVIGRRVETALLAQLAESALGRGRRRLCGWFLPTKKNAPAREFYQQHGFQLAGQNGEGALWALDLARHQIACPPWIKLISKNGDIP